MEFQVLFTQQNKKAFSWLRQWLLWDVLTQYKATQKDNWYFLKKPLCIQIKLTR